MLTGFALVIAASLFQGSFILPMTLVRKWRWEQTWLTFSLMGMLALNWLLGLLLVPDLIPTLASAPMSRAALLGLFGAGWGLGAVLFGLAMDRMGMSLGYPIIMGLIASLGALIPLVALHPANLFAGKGIALLLGTGLVVLGIALCSLSGARRQGTARSGFDAGGLLMAVLAGVLSCLPNVGVAFAGDLPSNAVWVLLFTTGGLVNCLYCAWLIFSRRPGPRYFGPDTSRNLRLAAVMAGLWIGSFYLYGAASSRLGSWGVVVGWPLFIALSIMAGVGWGLHKGEWAEAPDGARRLRNAGLMVLLLAVTVIAGSSFLPGGAE